MCIRDSSTVFLSHPKKQLLKPSWQIKFSRLSLVCLVRRYDPTPMTVVLLHRLCMTPKSHHQLQFCLEMFLLPHRTMTESLRQNQFFVFCGSLKAVSVPTEHSSGRLSFLWLPHTKQSEKFMRIVQKVQRLWTVGFTDFFFNFLNEFITD